MKLSSLPSELPDLEGSAFDMQVPKQTAREILMVCSNLEKLFEELESRATVRPSDEKVEPDGVQTSVDQTKNEIRRLRAFAADDTTMETTSVADYSADPEVPDIFTESSLAEETMEMTSSVEKIQQSVAVLDTIVNENPQWWNSAILVRRIKTYAIRSNYHARRTKSWGDHLRAHLLVSSTELNKTSQVGTVELREIRKQGDHSQRKKAELEKRRVILKHDMEEYSTEKEKLEKELNSLYANVIATSNERGVFRPDVPRAEAILLLEKLAISNPSIEGDCRLVIEWLTDTHVTM